MKKTVITISREFGSGGRTIAQMAAERLGYAFYDKALIERVSEESGYDAAFIEEHGEDANSTSSLLFNLARTGAVGNAGIPGISDKLYVFQHHVIRQIAKEGPCVIVGHCADYILSDCEEALHVFIHASKEFKAARIVELYGESEASPQKRLEEKDKKRKVYYKNYTGRLWGMSTNYHLSLDSGELGIENCVDTIVKLVKGSN